jgi:DNA repair protein RadC
VKQARRERLESAIYPLTRLNDDSGDQSGEGNPLSTSRERLFRYGVDSLSIAELLAILIRISRSSETALDGAVRIADRFADRIEGLLDCSPAELRQISPVATSTAYAQIMAGIELGRRIARAQTARQVSSIRITNTCDAVDFCRHRFWRLASDAANVMCAV